MPRGKSLQTKTLSARVPVDVIATVDELCKQRGVNRSQWLSTTIAEQQSNDFLKKGGQLQARTMPVELQNMLTAAGVTTVGILSYSLIGEALTKAKDINGNNKFSQGEIQFISLVTGLAIAMAGYGLIKNLIQE